MTIMNELRRAFRESTSEVEALLGMEDKGWINLSTANQIITDQERKTTVAKARYYTIKDPLGCRSVHLMTDYVFGTGISWSCEDEKTHDIMSLFWGAQQNAVALSPRGQHKSSEKLLVDGEIFFALFLGSAGEATIRRIDPLEITQIISNPDDVDDVRYYLREWTNQQGQVKQAYYRSFANEENKAVLDSMNRSVTATEDALVYHLAINDFATIRGVSYLYPAIGYMEAYREFLKARLAIMLALSKFAWRTKLKGTQATVNATKAQIEAEDAGAGQWLVENLSSDTQPIKTETGATQAYQDGRMLKLQVCSATGWPEQYYGDISIGNLATAKTVELPVMKMCQSYQSIWRGAFIDILDKVLEHAGILEERRYVDLAFPAITPADESALAQNISVIAGVFPEFLGSLDVQQQALLSIGIDDVNEVLDDIAANPRPPPPPKVIMMPTGIPPQEKQPPEELAKQESIGKLYLAVKGLRAALSTSNGGSHEMRDLQGAEGDRVSGGLDTDKVSSLQRKGRG